MKLLTFLVMVFPACGQLKDIDPMVYGSFFESFATEPQRIGILEATRTPSIEESAGLTSDETRILRQISVDFKIKYDAIMKTVPRMEIVYQHAEGQLSPELADRVRKIEEERIKLIDEHVKQVQKTFGQKRFEALNAYIQRPETFQMGLPPLLSK